MKGRRPVPYQRGRRVPHLRDSLIVAKVGIAQSATALLNFAARTIRQATKQYPKALALGLIGNLENRGLAPGVCSPFRRHHSGPGAPFMPKHMGHEWAATTVSLSQTRAQSGTPRLQPWVS
jgi:hypothetical protein